jgi:hypothetical protein
MDRRQRCVSGSLTEVNFSYWQLVAFFDKPRPAVPYSWLHGGPKGQLTPSVRDQPIEEGRAKDNNARRFVKKREGLYVVLEPVKNPEAYMNVDYDDDGDMVDMVNS